MKKLVLGVISSFMIFTMTSFADNNGDVSLEKKYRDSLLSIVESELNLSKSDLVKDGDAINKINEYVNNSLSLDVSIEEFESMVKSEVSKNSDIVNNDNYIGNNSQLNDETKGTCSNEKISEYIACAKNFVVREYDVNRKEVNTEKFENYVQDIYDEYESMGISKEFDDFFERRFDEDYDSAEKELIISKIVFSILVVVIITGVIIYMIRDINGNYNFLDICIIMSVIFLGVGALYYILK